MADQDTEITLGTGRLLGLFFGLVVLCAVFFVTGFLLGKNATPATTAAAADSVVAATAANPGGRPSPVPSEAKPECASTAQGCTPPATVPTAAAQQAATPEMASSPTPPAAGTTSGPGAMVGNAGASANLATVPATYTVQVAAVSKPQDAEALAAALRSKSYPVSVLTPATDNLFHVQVGPFGDLKDAEATRARLLGDGYNPILKR